MAAKMTKIDIRKTMPALYAPSPSGCRLVDVPALDFLMIDGEGDPNNSADYRAAVEALFSVSYAAKFIVKKGPQAVDFGVMPLEGLWWADDMADFGARRKDKWKWTMMIHQPPYATEAVLDEAIAQVRKKKGLSMVSALRRERFQEGRVAQILHIGPYDDEGPTIARMHQFIDENGGTPTGRHHEIYLSDPRRAAPDRLKTILRQPFR